MLTFVGKGYSALFIANFERIAQRIAAGDQIIDITFGPDDICAPILSDPACHCRNSTISERDSLAADALGDLLQQPIHPGAHITLTDATLDRLRQAFRAGTIRRACHGCQWVPLCDSIAASNFIDTRLLASRPSRD